MSVLSLKGITVEYSRGDRPFKVLDGLDLEMDKGEFVIVRGRSGSGKSTMLNIAAGMLRPTSGEVSINGMDILSMKDKELSTLRTRSIGFVPQGYSLLKELTVMDNVLLPSIINRDTDGAEDRALELLDVMGVADLKDEMPFILSGGEKKRVSIARALMNSPAILICDEPTSDLDSDNSRRIVETMRSVCDQGTAVLMVTHESDPLSSADRVCRMEDGKLRDE